MITDILSIGAKLIDKLIPDKEANDKAKFELQKMAQEGELKELEVSMSAILAEAKSADPWTSRARPSFLYVVYVLILFAIPMGIVSAFSGEIAARIAQGMQAWLAAIPEGLWVTFGVGYGGYTIARSAWDKRSAKQ